jgi:hypothetical protein
VDRLKTSDKSIKRDIVLTVARQIYIENALLNLTQNIDLKELSLFSIGAGKIWADTQIKYCENDEGLLDEIESEDSREATT